MPDVATSMPDDDRQATLARWLRPDGAIVAADEPVCELETDTASVAVPAAHAGTLCHLMVVGDVLAADDVPCRIDPLP